MRLGITGNTRKSDIWEAVSRVVAHFEKNGRDYAIDDRLSTGMKTHGQVTASMSESRFSERYFEGCDAVLSFGGDGTILNTAHEVAHSGVPILGVNMGQLGFLAHVEFHDVFNALAALDRGDWFAEERSVLELADRDADGKSIWALNEFAIQRQGDTGLLTIEVHVNDAFLNRYWADGLIFASPTGSTAYSLALGGPIMAPGCGTVLITPMAPHSLTIRPIVIPGSSTISVQIIDSRDPYIITADGVGLDVDAGSSPIHIRRGEHVVRLVQFTGQDSFASLRNKLMWGMRRTRPGE